MPVLHAYAESSRKSGMYIRSRVNGSPVTHQVSAQGERWLRANGFDDHGNLDLETLSWLVGVGYAYTNGGGTDSQLPESDEWSPSPSPSPHSELNSKRNPNLDGLADEFDTMSNAFTHQSQIEAENNELVNRVLAERRRIRQARAESGTAPKSHEEPADTAPFKPRSPLSEPASAPKSTEPPPANPRVESVPNDPPQPKEPATWAPEPIALETLTDLLPWPFWLLIAMGLMIPGTIVLRGLGN